MLLYLLLVAELVHVTLSTPTSPSCPMVQSVNLSEESNNFTYSLRFLRKYLKERTQFKLDTNPKNFEQYLQFNNATLDLAVQKIDRETCNHESVASCTCHPSGSSCNATLILSLLFDHKLQC